MEQLRKSYQSFKNALPSVAIHYAVKCNPDPEILKELDRIGSSFELASDGEAKLMKELGISSSKCINTHPMKTLENIRENIEFGIDVFVFDS